MFLVTGDDGLHTNGLRALLLRGQPGPAVHGEPGLLLPAAGGVPGGAAVPPAGLPGHVRHGGVFALLGVLVTTLVPANIQYVREDKQSVERDASTKN